MRKCTQKVRVRGPGLAAGLVAMLVAAGSAGAAPPPALATTPPPVEESVSGEIPSGAAAEGDALQALARVEEIVVTARRREEYLEDTPIAVTAISAAGLENSNVTRIDQIQQLVPNLSIQTGGSNQTAQISIRGVGSSGVGIAFDPGVGLYIDGIYLPRAQAAIFDVVDLESVQVLRGPQGTLFGKNTVGGALSVTTVKPREELGALISLRPGNLGQIRTRVTLDLPIRIGWFDDKLFSRLSFASRNRNGAVYNRFLDEYWGEENGLSFLGSLRFLPVPDITIDVSGSWFKDHVHNPLGECVEVQRTGIANTDEFWEACAATSPREVSMDSNQIAASSSWGTWATIAWDAGDLGHVSDIVAKSITSWRRQLSPSIGDVDATELRIIQVSNFGGGGTGGEPGQAEQVQQELQLAGSAWEERINLIAGTFFFWENADRTNGLDVPTVFQKSANRIITDNFTWAAFAQGTVAPTDWLSVTAGLRYTEDRKRAHQINRNFNRPPDDNITRDVSGEASFSSWTPMASVAFFLPEQYLEAVALDHLMTYFTYSRGFKGGGLNAVLASGEDGGLVPYQPETLDNFEIGAKAIALDNRLTFNLALFASLYDSIQRTQLESTVGDDGTITIRSLTLNAASASIEGVEAEFQAVPIEGMLVSGLIGYFDARYDSFPNAVNALGGDAIDRSGQQFIRSPAYNTFVSIQYSIPVTVAGWLDGYLTPRIEWSYRAAELFTQPEIPQGRQHGYHLLNARLSYEFMDGQAQVALWGRNLADELYINSVLPLAGALGIISRGYGPPRTWGGELTYRF